MTIPDNLLFDHPFIQKFYQTVKRYNMIQKGDSVLVGVSGGPDSMALLYSLLALTDPMELQLGVAHLNHCLRQSASDHDEKFVKSVAKKKGVPVFVKKKDIANKRRKTGLSLEEAGREARYHFFNTICRKNFFDKIAVGHHNDDNAEQILLNLFRGSGPAGMVGIPMVRKNIIRPLIRTSRSEILDYLKSNKIEYVIDQSNADEQFARNNIRHYLMPLLKQCYNPQISETLNRLSTIARAEEEWINSLVNPLFEASVISSDDRQMILAVSQLQRFHRAAQRRVLRKAILRVKKDLKRIRFSHIDSIIRLVNSDPAQARLDLPDRIRILKETNHLTIRKELKNLRITKSPAEDATPVVFERQVPKSAIENQQPVLIKEINNRISFYKMSQVPFQNPAGLRDHTAVFDWDTIQFPIIIRNFRPGDRFSPIGMTGTQKLKNFFVNNKINPLQRATIPIFISGHEIMWVGGLRIADPFKLTQKTKTILKVEISSGTTPFIPMENDTF